MTLPADGDKGNAACGRKASGKSATRGKGRRKGKPLTKRELASLKPAGLPVGIPMPLRPLAVAIGELHPDPDNVRLHPERNLDAIKASLERFGQQAPAVYVLRKGRRIVIKGNGLLEAAKLLRWTHLAAVESGLPEQEAKAFAIADNRTTDLSEFDEALLAAQLQELADNSFDLEAVGFSDAELRELLKDAEPDKGGETGGVKGKRAHGISGLHSVVVECKDERDQLRFYERMKKEGRKCKLYML